MSNRRKARPAAPAHPAPRMSAREVLAAIREQVTAELAALPGRDRAEAARRLADGEGRLRRQATVYRANGRADLGAALMTQADRLAAALAELPPPTP